MLGLSLARAGAIALGNMPTDARWRLIEHHGAERVSHVQWIDGGAWSAWVTIRSVQLYGDPSGRYVADAARYADRAISLERSPFEGPT